MEKDIYSEHYSHFLFSGVVGCGEEVLKYLLFICVLLAYFFEFFLFLSRPTPSNCPDYSIVYYVIYKSPL